MLGSHGVKCLFGNSINIVLDAYSAIGTFPERSDVFFATLFQSIQEDSTTLKTFCDGRFRLKPNWFLEIMMLFKVALKAG